MDLGTPIQPSAIFSSDHLVRAQRATIQLQTDAGEPLVDLVVTGPIGIVRGVGIRLIPDHDDGRMILEVAGRFMSMTALPLPPEELPDDSEPF